MKALFVRKAFGRSTARCMSSNSTASRPRVMVTRKIPAPALQTVSNVCQIEHHWNSEDALPREQFLKWAKDVEGIYCILSDKIDKEFLASAPQLRTISTMSVGFDHIDLEECRKRGIKVGNTPGVLTETTADLVLALLLATARRIPEAANAVSNGLWKPSWRPMWLCGKDVFGSTVGIVGIGRIGQAVARRLKGFGCNILYTGPRPKPDLADPVGAKYVDMKTLLNQSDFVIPLCPLNAATRGLFNAEAFAQMKPGSIFINASRGPVVDQIALVHALRNGPMAAAGLDVTDPEPLPMDHPLMNPDLADRLVILPHIGSASVATRMKMADIAAANLIAGLKGEPMPHPL